GFDAFLVDLRLEVARQLRPALAVARHREEYLARIEAAAVVVSVLGRFGVELEGGEDDELRLGHQRLRLLDGLGHLALLQGRVLGTEGNDDALRLLVLRLAVGVQIAAAGQRLKACETNVLPILAANAGAQEFVAPLALAQRLA